MRLLRGTESIGIGLTRDESVLIERLLDWYGQLSIMGGRGAERWRGYAISPWDAKRAAAGIRKWRRGEGANE